MSNSTDRSAVVSRPRVTWMMFLCGAFAAVAAGGASAATADAYVPRQVVRYSESSLATDAGAKALYHRLVEAAKDVCPISNSGSRFITDAVRECRAQAVARAVHDVNSPRLAALYAANAHSG